MIEVMRELSFRNHLRQLGERRDRQMKRKGVKKKEACTGGAEQTSKVNNVIKLHNNDTTTKEICQIGGVLGD